METISKMVSQGSIPKEYLIDLLKCGGDNTSSHSDTKDISCKNETECSSKVEEPVKSISTHSSSKVHVPSVCSPQKKLQNSVSGIENGKRKKNQDGRGSFNLKLRRNKKQTGPKKYIKAQITRFLVKAEDEQSSHTVIIGITAHNEMARGSVKNCFEWRPKVWVRVCEIMFYMMDDEHNRPTLGNMDSTTEQIFNPSNWRVYKVRANPGELDDSPQQENGYPSYQAVGIFELKNNNADNCNKEVNAILTEFQNILSSSDFHFVYKMACYLEFICADGISALDFLEDTKFPEATDFKASVLMLIQKEFRTTNKKLFKILVEDKNQALRSDLGSHDIQSTFNVAMDEFLCNSEIKSLVQDNLGNHFDMNIHEKVLFKKRLPGRDLHEYEFLN